MKYLILFLLVFTLSCSDEKSVLLPEISDAKISRITDVSPIYLFYDPTKTDSIELNKANVISTTNWLVNVDKRLTLAQAIPSIIILQNKKRNAETRKNNGAKNFYTCNDISIKNLGFIEFTNVIYKLNTVSPNITPDYQDQGNTKIIVDFSSVEDIKFVTIFKDSILKKSTLKSLKNALENISLNDSYEIVINMSDRLTFQDYISFKSILANIDFSKITVNDNEFIY